MGSLEGGRREFSLVELHRQHSYRRDVFLYSAPEASNFDPLWQSLTLFVSPVEVHN